MNFEKEQDDNFKSEAKIEGLKSLPIRSLGMKKEIMGVGDAKFLNSLTIYLMITLR